MPAREESHHLVPDAPAPWCLSREKIPPTAVPAWPGPERRTSQKRGIDLQQTTNYQLSQWAAEDRILRTDFNSDNAKIDAALKSQATSLTTLSNNLSTISQRAGAQAYPNTSVVQDMEILSISMAGIDWSTWKAVHVDIYPYTPGGGTFRMEINGDSTLGYLGSGSGNVTLDSSSRKLRPHLIFFPMYDRWRTVSGLILGTDAPGAVRSNYYAFASFNTLQLRFTVNGCVFGAGTQYRLWGEK